MLLRGEAAPFAVLAGGASEVSHRAATHGHSPEEPLVSARMQERIKYLLVLPYCVCLFVCVCVSLPS